MKSWVLMPMSTDLLQLIAFLNALQSLIMDNRFLREKRRIVSANRGREKSKRKIERDQRAENEKGFKGRGTYLLSCSGNFQLTVDCIPVINST